MNSIAQENVLICLFAFKQYNNNEKKKKKNSYKNKRENE